MKRESKLTNSTIRSKSNTAKEVSLTKDESKSFVLGSDNDLDATYSDHDALRSRDYELVDRIEDHKKKLEEVKSKYAAIEEELEISPIGNYVLVLPLAKNPFTKDFISESGLIVSEGGLAPINESHETGNMEEEESFIHVGVVQEVGPECKWIKPEDTIMWTKPSEVPVPFYNQNLVLVNETRVMVVVNTGLSKRFSKLK